ncbi:MAG: hypothetical protein M3A44_02610 [Gammaproteobacteria bacterium]
MVNRKAQKAAKQDRAANSFEVVVWEWYAKNAPNWVEHHGNRIIRRLERGIFPWISGRPIADVTAPELLATVQRIEKRGCIGRSVRSNPDRPLFLLCHKVIRGCSARQNHAPFSTL